MKYFKIRKIFQEHFAKSFPDIKTYKNFSVVNDGYPGTFNLSFSETEFLEEFQDFLDVKHELNYIKIQPCIRHNDFLQILKKHSKKSYMYLGLFDMAGVCFASKNPKLLNEQTEKLIESVYSLLVEKLKLSNKNIFIKCFSGGNVAEVTKGKYLINKNIDKDSLSIKKWTSLGIHKDNILMDNSRDSLLTLYLHRPTPWGYRTEILYKLSNEEFLDIGTIEYFPWKPLIKDSEIIDFTNWENSCCLAAFGLERLNYLVNNLKHIREVDSISPLFNRILGDSKNKDENSAFILSECIRTAQRILTDSGSYENLSRNRRRKLRDYTNEMFRLSLELGISDDKIKEYLKIHADISPWYPELEQKLELVYNELLKLKK